MNLKRVNGKRVLLRVDFNVPFFFRGKSKRIADDFRIKSHLSTISALLQAGAQIFLITHLEKDGLTPGVDFLKNTLEKLLKKRVRFLKGAVPQLQRRFKEKIILFDNIRLNSGEKKNSAVFAKCLARWGDIYVNDAFSASHRVHASVVKLPEFLPSDTGPLLEKEIKNLSRAFSAPEPFLLVLAGKKFSTKEPLVNKFLRKADYIFIGGALANTFLRQRGFEIGRSDAENAKISSAILRHRKILLPEDVFVSRNGKKYFIPLKDIKKEDLIYDAGPETIKKMSDIALRSKFILWNGTLGLCEAGFDFGTKSFARALEKSRAFKIAGGGDTAAAIRKHKLEKNFNFISTGGGAMLEFLAKGTLPGIEALKKSKKH